MPATPTQGAPGKPLRNRLVDGSDDVAYIRGGGGMAVDTRRAARWGAGFILILIAVLVAVLSVEASNDHSRMQRLQHHGVPVTVTVTSCFGLASGTGATEAGYTCRGDFVLDGQTYNEVITGNLALYPAGATLAAVAVPGDPSLVATARAVADTHTSWTAYLTPIILFVVLVIGGAGYARFLRPTKKPPAVVAPADPADPAPDPADPAPELADSAPQAGVSAVAPAIELRHWMDHYADFVAGHHVAGAESGDVRSEARQTLGTLLSAAIAAGSIRRDANADDVLQALMGIWAVAGLGHDDERTRLLNLLMDGLRYQA